MDIELFLSAEPDARAMRPTPPIGMDALTNRSVNPM
jgi:hypothetical protein